MRVVAACVALALAPAGAAARPSTAMTIDSGFGLAVYTSGVDAAPIAPATQDSFTLTFPIRRVHRGVYEHRGGFDLQDVAHDTDLELRNPTFRFSHGRVRVSGRAFLDGIDDGRFMFATGRGTPRHAELRLSRIAAAALNSVFLTERFAPGDRFAVSRSSPRPSRR